MIQIRPVSDLRNKFPEIETKLDEADRQAAMTDERLSHKTVFGNVRSTIHGIFHFFVI